MTRFDLSQRNFWPGCHELDVVGELDLAVSEKLRAALDRAVDQDCHVLVDLSACEFIDVSGVTALTHARDRLSVRGRQLLLYGARGQVGRMLSVTGLAGIGPPAVETSAARVLMAA